MKKKILSISCTAALVCSLMGCAGQAAEGDVTQTPADTSVEVVADAENETGADEAEPAGVYVKMNIPYGDFFAAEFEGGADVDAVTSATMNKPGNENLTGGTYHLEDNSKILGVSFPVFIPEGTNVDESLKVADEASLYAAPDYSYVELSEKPVNYKEISVDGSGNYSFGQTMGDFEQISIEDASVNTATHWGDYEIDLDQSLSELSVFAATIHTTDGKTYGMRSLENVWRGFEIAFATTDAYQEPHGNTVEYLAYEDLPGKTVDTIVLYTNEGVMTASVDLYLPLKFENTITIADAELDAKTTTVSFEGFPEDYSPAYSVEGDSADITCDGENITWTDALAGKYVLTVSDESGVYAPYTSEFVLSTDRVVANAIEDGIEKSADASDEEYAAYLKNITGYVVNGEEISGSGRHGAKIITEDGTADKTLSNVFDEVGEYEVIIRSAGYPDVTITVTITEVAPSEEENGH